MLKPLIGQLLLANALLLAAQAGLFDGLTRAKDREPERLARQVNPNAVRLSPATGPAAAQPPSAPGANGAGAPPMAGGAPASTVPDGGASAVPAAPAAPAALPAPAVPSAPGPGGGVAPASSAGAGRPAVAQVCLQSGALTADQLGAVERGLRAAGVPEGQWRHVSVPPREQHLIVMGGYADRAALRKKHDELKRRRVPWVELTAQPGLPAGLLPGLELGRFDSAAAAQADLERLAAKGVRSARLVSLPAGPAQVQLRFAAADAGLQTRLAQVRWPADAGPAPCPTVVSAAARP